MTVCSLRGMGHEVLDIRGTGREGITDAEVWKLAQNERRVLITTDKGFAQYRGTAHHGLLIVRLRSPNRHRIHARIMEAVTKFRESEWDGMLVTMRDTAQSITRTQKTP